MTDPVPLSFAVTAWCFVSLASAVSAFVWWKIEPGINHNWRTAAVVIFSWLAIFIGGNWLIMQTFSAQ